MLFVMSIIPNASSSKVQYNPKLMNMGLEYPILNLSCISLFVCDSIFPPSSCSLDNSSVILSTDGFVLNPSVVTIGSIDDNDSMSACIFSRISPNLETNLSSTFKKNLNRLSCIGRYTFAKWKAPINWTNEDSEYKFNIYQYQAK